MGSITEYEFNRLKEFFGSYQENEKKMIAVAKTITKNTLTHLSANGEFAEFH